METGRRESVHYTLEKFDGHFESLYLLATNINGVIEQLTAATTTKYIKIAKLLGKISANALNTASATSGTCTIYTTDTGGDLTTHNTGTCAPTLLREEKYKLNKHITQLKLVVWGKLVVGAFFSMHGNEVCKGHTSHQYNYKLPGHVDFST